MIRLFACFDAIVGILATSGALGAAWTMQQSGTPGASDLAINALVAVWGISSLAASVGLFDLRPYGLSFHLAGSVGWLIASLVIIFWKWGTPEVGFLAPFMIAFSIPAFVSVIYFRRAAVRARFERQETLAGSESNSAGPILAVEIVAIALLLFVVYPLVSGGSGRTRTKRTMADMRAIANAVESYAMDYNRYPSAPSIDTLAPLVTPTYIRSLPRMDGWGNEYRYQAWREKSDTSQGAQHYSVGSGGENRRFALNLLRSYKGSDKQRDDDIVMSDGSFVSFPDGTSSWHPPSTASAAPVSTPPPAPPATAKDMPALFDRATVLYKSDRGAEAIPLFEEFLEKNPDHALAEARLAGSYYKAERYRESIPHFQKAAALENTDYQSRSGLGLAYEKIGKPELGISPSRDAVRLQPANATVVNNLGWVLLQSNHALEAADVLQQAVRLDPKDPLPRRNLGEAWLRAGKIERARAQAQILRRLDKQSADDLDAQIAKSHP